MNPTCPYQRETCFPILRRGAPAGYQSPQLRHQVEPGQLVEAQQLRRFHRALTPPCGAVGSGARQWCCRAFPPHPRGNGARLDLNGGFQRPGSLRARTHRPFITEVSGIRLYSGTNTRSFREEMRKVTGVFVATSPSTSTGTGSSLRTIARFVWKYSTSFNSVWVPMRIVPR